MLNGTTIAHLALAAVHGLASGLGTYKITATPSAYIPGAQVTLTLHGGTIAGLLLGGW